MSRYPDNDSGDDRTLIPYTLHVNWASNPSSAGCLASCREYIIVQEASATIRQFVNFNYNKIYTVPLIVGHPYVSRKLIVK